MSKKPSILVLCTGNSARSQIAEALLRKHIGARFDVFSAGTEPAAEIHPLAIEVLKEAGIDPVDQKPKHFREYLGHLAVNTLIIVCGGANRSCPSVWPGIFERHFWPFEDPASFEGSLSERRDKFRESRNAIEHRILEWVKESRS